jgi:hypothetical protein
MIFCHPTIRSAIKPYVLTESTVLCLLPFFLSNLALNNLGTFNIFHKAIYNRRRTYYSFVDNPVIDRNEISEIENEISTALGQKPVAHIFISSLHRGHAARFETEF